MTQPREKRILTEANADLQFAKIVYPSGDTTGVDDSTAIQDAWDAGRSVRLLQDETYWVKDLVLKSNCHIWLEGATLKLPAGANTDMIVSDAFDTWTGSTANGDVSHGINRAGIHAPGVIDGNKANQTTASTTIASGSNGASLPQSTINVGSTTGFPTAGTFSVLTNTGLYVIAYTGKTSTTFTGCTGGGGSLSTGTPVYFKGFGIRVFWRNSVLGGRGNLEVRNCVADGIWTEWGTGGTTAVKTDGSMENDNSGIKAYSNGRYGIANRGPHDSWWGRVLCFANGVGGLINSGGGTAYFQQVHTWGTPQSIGVDCYTETHILQGAQEVTNVAGSMGMRINGVLVTYRGRVFTPPGVQPTAPLGGNVGIVMRGGPTNCDIDAQVLDCNQGALVTVSDGGSNRIRLQAAQSTGPAVVRFLGSVASGSNGVNVNTFAGSGTLNVDDTTNWPSSGALMVGTQSGPKLVTYTGKTSTTFTGCTCASSGVLSTGHAVTFCTLVGGTDTSNDLANVHSTTSLDVTVGGGTPCPGVSTRSYMRRASGTISPSPTVLTFGTPLTVTATGAAGYLSPFTITFWGAANVATENLTFRTIAYYADGTSTSRNHATGTYTITANGQSLTLALDEISNLWKDATTIRKLEISMRSSIATSAATVNVIYFGQN
ncbi:hypothetical protein AB4Z39_10850 [Mycobacterium adipatum]|uniref:hypothetical protein n=1 Tax=Mycobacterium adipatum TaxID=1682113 RepID=UPI0034E0CE40